LYAQEKKRNPHTVSLDTVLFSVSTIAAVGTIRVGIRVTWVSNMGRREKRRAKVDLDEEEKAEDAGKSSKSFLILSSSDDEDAKEDPSLKIVEKSLLMRAAKLAPDDAVLGETSGGGGSSGVVALSSLSALEEEAVEVTGGVGGSDANVGPGAGDLGRKKVVKRVRKKKIKKREVGEQTVSIFTSLILFAEQCSGCFAIKF
jgi:hypothetical protein